MALRHAKCFSEMDVLKVMSNDSHDVETNKVYCQTKIGESIARLSDAERLIDDTQNGWDQVLPRWPPGGAIRSNGGDKGAATRATQDVIPGGKNEPETQLAVYPPWDNPDHLGKLIHESGEWYGWASPFQVTKRSHPWLREYDDLLEKLLLPPSKKQRSQNLDESRQKKLHKLLRRNLRQELNIYFFETMDIFNTSMEAFAVCMAEGQNLYVWMAELLKTDPDCLEELQGIQTDLAFMKDMLDKVRYDLSKASKLGGA